MCPPAGSVEVALGRDEIFQRLRSYLVDLFDIPADQISLDSRLREDLDLDSIDAVDLIVKLQELTRDGFLSQDAPLLTQRLELAVAALPRGISCEKTRTHFGSEALGQAHHQPPGK